MSEKYKFGKIRPPGLDRSHKGLEGSEVEVLEKIDGSNFSFWLEDGRVLCRSRNNLLDQTCDKLFSKAWAYVTTLEDRLSSRFVYRAEAVHAPRHNVLCYERAPVHGLVLWAAENKHTGEVLPYRHMRMTAERLGVEVAPLIGTVTYTGRHCLDAYVEGESLLGGPREGVVARSKDGVYVKVVGAKFREKATGRTMRRRVGGGAVASIAGQYRTEARWRKAVQHLHEAGTLTGSMKDVGPLIRRCNEDLEEEEREAIMAELYQAFRKPILRTVTSGFASWYEKELADGQG